MLDGHNHKQYRGGKGAMSRESRILAGVLLVVIPTVMYGGLSLLYFLTRSAAGYVDNPLRHDESRHDERSAL